jgi:hypothetical protein
MIIKQVYRAGLEMRQTPCHRQNPAPLPARQTERCFSTLLADHGSGVPVKSNPVAVLAAIKSASITSGVFCEKAFVSLKFEKMTSGMPTLVK